jgi:large exoprotein involved in heme utilization and adhesion
VVGTAKDGSLSRISTSTQTGSTGSAGDIIITTDRLSIRDGAGIGGGTLGKGTGGSVQVDAKDLIEVVGTAPDSQTPSVIAARTRGEGLAGNVQLKTKRLNIRDGAQVTVSSSGSGRAGQIQVHADSINLDTAGKISAATASGEGGDIFLNSQNLQLRDGSSISATAGLAGGGGNGGNITIDTDTLAAIQGSSITANAFTGRGGNILITTQGIFQSPDSIFDASSQFGVDGTVEVRSLGLEPDEALVPYNEVFIPMEEVMKNSCFAPRNKKRVRLVVTGNGGLPAGPGDSVMPMPLFSAEELEAQSPSQVSPAPANSEWQVGDPVVEATGIIKTKDGRTLLGVVGSSLPNPESAMCQ